MRSVYVQVMWVSVSLLGLTGGVGAYPGGTPNYVTDVAPFCASCHSSVSADQMIGLPPGRIQSQLVAGKHLARIRAAREGTPYARLTEEQREELIRGIQKIDAAASVKLIAPAKLKAGQIFEVTVEATGGGGPVVGIALVVLMATRRSKRRRRGAQGVLTPDQQRASKLHRLMTRRLRRIGLDCQGMTAEEIDQELPRLGLSDPASAAEVLAEYSASRFGRRALSVARCNALRRLVRGLKVVAQ